MSEKKKYMVMSLVITLALIACIMVFSFLPFKELPFIYNEF